MTDESAEARQLFSRLRAGEPEAMAALFDHYGPRLRRLVCLRLDRRLAARLDPSDVLQEVYLDMAGQIHGYLRQPRVSFYVWLRGLTWERLLKLQRRHLGAACRSARQEQALPPDSSDALAQQLLAPGPSPSEDVLREELRRRVQDALARLGGEDREVILMRDFEGLSNGEVAQALGLTPSGATMRYGRALFRLKELLAAARPAKGRNDE
jgi:RNA polymerase sigma-70 factor (ECF subfamily)